MKQSSNDILERFRRGRPRPGDIDLTLRPAYRDLLHRLGHPQNRLPPVFHVAGTNGKGSVCAFLRAILEAAGYRTHVYTSPHLVNFHERIRIAGKLIEESELAEILGECEKLSEPGGITYFEAATAAAFTAFARHPADFTILETGLGGRLDATNVVEKPLATIITRISRDHIEYLGTTLGEIAREKAGIMREGVPCFTAPQPDAESLHAMREAAEKTGAPTSIGGENWRVETDGKNQFRFIAGNEVFELPLPALIGAHQLWNAGLAIAALTGAGIQDVLSPNAKCQMPNAIAQGLRNAEWPARLQHLKNGRLTRLLPPEWEVWLDGGHNDSAGEILAAQAAVWRAQDARPLHLICGMIRTKNPEEFLAPLAPHVTSLHAVTIPDEPQTFSADDLAARARNAKIRNAAPARDIHHALTQIKNAHQKPARVLICGSLYLAGEILRLEGFRIRDSAI